MKGQKSSGLMIKAGKQAAWCVNQRGPGVSADQSPGYSGINRVKAGVTAALPNR